MSEEQHIKKLQKEISDLKKDLDYSEDKRITLEDARDRDAKLYQILMADRDEELRIRKSTEEELRKFSHAVEQSPLALMITTVDGNIEYINPKFSEMTGYDKKEIIDQKTGILKSGEMSETFFHQMLQTITKGEIWNGEILNRKKNGS